MKAKDKRSLGLGAKKAWEESRHRMVEAQKALGYRDYPEEMCINCGQGAAKYRKLCTRCREARQVLI